MDLSRFDLLPYAAFAKKGKLDGRAEYWVRDTYLPMRQKLTVARLKAEPGTAEHRAISRERKLVTDFICWLLDCQKLPKWITQAPAKKVQVICDNRQINDSYEYAGLYVKSPSGGIIWIRKGTIGKITDPFEKAACQKLLPSACGIGETLSIELTINQMAVLYRLSKRRGVRR